MVTQLGMWHSYLDTKNKVLEMDIDIADFWPIGGQINWLMGLVLSKHELSGQIVCGNVVTLATETHAVKKHGAWNT